MHPRDAGATIAFPTDASYLLLGRQALCLTLGHIRRLWLPSYFCQEVTQYMVQYGYDVMTYDDDFTREVPLWPENIALDGSEAIVVVNYFGLRRKLSYEHLRAKSRCVIVEDHSHDPLSSWALQSEADFIFASLRKTLPVPDGAVVWSPRGHNQPSLPESCSLGSALKYSAMALKSLYLHDAVRSEPLKEAFRGLLQASESMLCEEGVGGITVWSKEIVRGGYPVSWRARRRANYLKLLEGVVALAERLSLSIVPLHHGLVPLGFPIVFPIRALRDECRAYLAKHGVYCPIHWVGNPQNIWALTIPIDHRYRDEHMEYVITCLNRWQGY